MYRRVIAAWWHAGVLRVPRPGPMTFAAREFTSYQRVCDPVVTPRWTPARGHVKYHQFVEEIMVGPPGIEPGTP